nr:hypothetical protein [Pandoravirus massiliensis]
MGQSTSTPLPETTMDDTVDDVKDIVMIEKQSPSELPTTTSPATESVSAPTDAAAPPVADGGVRSESVPADGSPIITQGALDAALAAIHDPASVTKVTVFFSHKVPIADAALLDEHGFIKDEKLDDAYDDHAKNAFHLNALSAFARLSELHIEMDDGCCHPVFLTVPRAAWSRLALVSGDWATFRVLD